MILGYLPQDYEECRLKIALPITMTKKTSNILIAGKSGSGNRLRVLPHTLQDKKQSK